MNKIFNLRQISDLNVKQSLAVISIIFLLNLPFALAGVREPAVAGQFYPGDSKELSSYVDSLLAKANPSASEGEAIAFLVPHAGYPFSGAVAAYVYKLISELKPQTIIFVGTAHHYPLAGGSIFPKGSFKTPLGEVQIDSETAKKLIDRDHSLADVTELAHVREHSVETQLPFLQRALPKAAIVPIIIGNATFEKAVQLGDAIAEVVKENNEAHHPTVVIASTDLSHYPNQADAKVSDTEILEALKSLNPESFWKTNQKLIEFKIPNLLCAMCGDFAMVSVLQAAKKLGATQASLLKYANSADAPFGDPNKVVGYGAVAFSKVKKEQLSLSDQKKLLEFARKTLEQFVNQSKGEAEYGGSDSEKPVAVFVTLMKNGELRGCIGSPEPADTLAKAVKKFTIAAASRDPRFLPVKADELAAIDIEISILTPHRNVANVGEIEPKKHGVIIEAGGRRGLFLPQVWEMIPDRVQFLNTLASEKAGLAPDAWKNAEATLSVFEVVKFSEKEFSK